MADLKATNSNTMAFDGAHFGHYAAFWKSCTIDLPLVLTSASLRFAAHRLQAHADYLASLSHCRDMSDALESQASFTRTTVADYAGEAGALMHEARAVVAVQQAA